MLPDRSARTAEAVSRTDDDDDDAAAAAADLADAHHAIDYASRWVNKADTKAGLLSAALAVVIAATA